MKNLTENLSSVFSRSQIYTTHFKTEIQLWICFILITCCSANTICAQNWKQLGPGAGGQERAVYCYDNPTSGKYDFYVGSDVSGVWAAHNIDPNFVNDPTQYHWVYISNDDITRFINKFVQFNGTDDLLLVGYRNGIGLVNLSNQTTAMTSSWFQKNAWVSDIYVTTTSNIYFTTGSTRASDEPGNYKNYENVYDFYYATINATGIITPPNGIELPGLRNGQNVYCLWVNEGSPDDFLVGTESGLYVFDKNDVINGPIPQPILGPYRSNNYKVTSILKKSTSEYFITIHGMGLFLFNKLTNEWTSLINSLRGAHSNSSTTDYHDFKNDQSVLGFTRLIFVPGTNAGWILMNEENLVSIPNDTKKFYVGALYSKDNSGVPDGSWTALNVDFGPNDWGWNTSTPCSNVNSTLLTPNNFLMAGKSGNIFMTGQPISTTTNSSPLAVTWQQIYTCEQSTACLQSQFMHKGYVNTAPKCVFNDDDNRVWIGMHDRLLWVSEDGGDYFKEIETTTSNCDYPISTLSGTNSNCPNLSIQNKNITDCFYITESPANENYACIGSGYASGKGLGFDLKLNSSDIWEQVGDPLCGDPVKLVFSSNEMYVLVNEINGPNKVYWLNSSSLWENVTIGTSPIAISDILINDAGDKMYVINGDYDASYDLYAFARQGTDPKNFGDAAPANFTPTGVKCKTMALLTCTGCTGYKVLVGTEPRDYSIYDNLYIMDDNLLNSSALVNGNEFKDLYIDDLDQSDGGVNYIDVNPRLNAIYVSTVYYDQTNPPIAKIYKATVQTNFTISNWVDLTSGLPNKAVKYISSNGSSCGNEFIYTSVRGLGVWKYNVNGSNDGTISLTNPLCSGSNNGELTANPPQGWTGLSYEWEDNSTNPIHSGLSAGTYTVTVTATSGCGSTTTSYTQEYTLKELILDKQIINACSGSSNGSATVLDNCVAMPYTYLWSNSATTKTVTGLAAGVYTVTVTDDNNCNTSLSLTVSIASINASVPTQNLTAAACSTSTSNPGIGGTLKVSTNGSSGETQPFQFKLSSGDWQLAPLFENLAVGTYTVTVMDFNGCTKSTNATIGAASKITSLTNTTGGTYEIDAGTSTLNVSTNTTLTDVVIYFNTGQNINVAPSITNTFTINGSSLQGCNSKWDGIQLNSGASFIFDNSEIMDASIGLTANAASVFKISNSIFDNNDLAIKIKDGSSFASSYIINTRFDYSDLPEFDYRLPLLHIFISNATNVLIGSDDATASSENYFTHAQTGIGVSNSDNVKICNSIFRKLGIDEIEEPGVIIRYGFGVNAGNNGTTFKSLTVSDFSTGNGTWAGNDFDNIINGVTLSGLLHADVKKNDFNDNYSAVYLTNMAGSGGNVEIENNTMNNFKHAINSSYVRVPCIFSNNKMNMISNNKPVAYNFSHTYGNEAISIRSSIGSMNNITIQGNQINNTRNGIYLINVEAATLGDVSIGGGTYPDNHVWFQIPASKITTPHHGVLVVNSSAINVAKNFIEWNSVPTDNEIGLMRGISFKSVTNSVVQENKIINAGAGMHVFGDCTNSSLLCNKWTNNWHGVYLDDNSPNNKLSDQGTWNGSDGESWNNWWDGNQDDHVSGSIASGYSFQWMFKNQGGSDDPHPHPFQQNVLVTHQVTQFTTVCTPPQNFMNNDERNARYGYAVGDSSEAEIDSTEYAYSDKEVFYKQAKSDSTMLNIGSAFDQDYQNKFDSLQHGNIGKFEDVKSLLSVGDFQYAKAILESIDAQNLIDQNKKFILKLVAIEYNPDNDFDRDTILMISDIAYQHPFYGGEGVFLARAILNLIIEDYLLPQRKAFQHSIIKPHLRNKLKLYPNPATDKVNLYSIEKFVDGDRLCIFNMMGQLIITYELPHNENVFLFSVKDLKPGILNCKIISDSSLKQIGQLVIMD